MYALAHLISEHSKLIAELEVGCDESLRLNNKLHQSISKVLDLFPNVRDPALPNLSSISTFMYLFNHKCNFVFYIRPDHFAKVHEGYDYHSDRYTRYGSNLRSLIRAGFRGVSNELSKKKFDLDIFMSFYGKHYKETKMEL